MKIGEILELTRHERLSKIAKERLEIGEKPAREALKKAGCYAISGKRGWLCGGDPAVLERSIYDYVGAGARKEPKANVGTKEPRKESVKVQKRDKTEEQKNVERKRASFDIGVDILKRLKIQAIIDDRNVYELVEEAIEEYLKRNEKQ